MKCRIKIYNKNNQKRSRGGTIVSKGSSSTYYLRFRKDSIFSGFNVTGDSLFRPFWTDSIARSSASYRFPLKKYLRFSSWFILGFIVFTKIYYTLTIGTSFFDFLRFSITSGTFAIVVGSSVF